MTGKEIMAEEFERAGMRGYRADEVDAFLQKVAAYVDEQEGKINDLTYKIQILADKIEEYKADEENIRDALLNAQKLGSSILNEAKAKAESLTREAKAKADGMVGAAEKTSSELMDQAKENVEQLTRASLQKPNAELASIKKVCEAERRHLETMKQEVSVFRASILKQYKAHLDLLSALPSVEEKPASTEPEPAPEPAGFAPQPQEDPEAAPAPVEESVSFEETGSGQPETISSDISGIQEEMEQEEKAQTKEFTGEPKNEEKHREEEKAEYAFNRRSSRQSYMEKFGELKFGGFNDKDKK